jgi:hypothetical protein
VATGAAESNRYAALGTVVALILLRILIRYLVSLDVRLPNFPNTYGLQRVILDYLELVFVVAFESLAFLWLQMNKTYSW